MAKISLIQRNLKRKQLVKKHIKKRQLIKRQIKLTQTFEEQLVIQKKIQALPRNSSITRIRSRCWLTGRSRGYFRLFGLSRHVLREMAHECLVPGLKKASW